MIEDIGYIEPVLTIKPESFDIEEIPNSELIVEIGASYFRFAIKSDSTFMALEDFQYATDKSSEEFIEAIFNEHPYLSARFWNKIVVIIYAQKKTVVPAVIKDAQAGEVWETLFGELPAKRKIMVSHIDEYSIIYDANKGILQFLSSFYEDTEFEIRLADTVLFNSPSKDSFLLFDGLGTHLLMHKPQLNTYYAETWEPLMTLKNEENLSLIGEITEYSTEYQKLLNETSSVRKAFLHQSIRLSPLFDQIAQFRYFIIFNS